MRMFLLFGFFLVIVFVLGFFVLKPFDLIVGEEKEPVEIVVEKPFINVREVSYKVAVGKPEVVLFQEALRQASGKSESEITIYNNDFGLVKDVRSIDLEKGVNLVEFEDVPSLIQPESVVFMDKTFHKTFVLEQNYDYDLVSAEKLLSKYVGKDIVVQVDEGSSVKDYSGVLLSSSNNKIILQTKEGIVALNSYSKILYPELPSGLLTKPSLVWKVYAENPGKRETETMYLSSGFGWSSDYVAVVNADDSKLDLKGWATITNNSGTSYNNVSLKLVAGEVNRVPKYDYRRAYYENAVYSATTPEKQFSQESFFEYYLYSLERPTDLLNNQSKQISLLNASNISAKKEFVFDNTLPYNYYRSNIEKSPVKVKLNFSNSSGNNLGLPLPKGIIRVYKKDSQGKLQFIGEDQINHTKTNDELSFFLGNAFDITGSRIQVSADSVSDRLKRETYSITLENQKDVDVVVKVKEPAYSWTGWEVVKSTLPFEKKSSSEFQFVVKVPAKGKFEFSYTIEYRS